MVGDQLAAGESDHSEPVDAPSALPGGAALLTGPPSSRRAWVLIDDGGVSRLGGALAWSSRVGVSSLDVFVDGSAAAPGIVARRAGCFAIAPRVWAVSGRTASLASAAPVVADLPPGPPADLVSLLSSHGLEVVWEHGVLRGEVLGLEVARTVGDQLEVGVGRFDRIARLEMRPSEDLSSALTEAAAAVRNLRRRGAPVHPANTLARSRWLRSVVVGSPSLVGCSVLEPVAPPLPWFDLPEVGAAPCVGTLSDGSPVVVVCSVGVDMDLVPTGADAWLMHGADSGASVLFVVPEGDDLPVTRSMVAGLTVPAGLVTVGRDWDA